MDKPTPHEELETLVGALIAQLVVRGGLDAPDIEAIARRLHHAGMPAMAEEVRAIPLGDALDAPIVTAVTD